MPDIAGILSTFKRELFSGRYMIVVFIWLLILIFSPASIKNFISSKTDIPYSFQLFIFSISVLLYSLFWGVIKRIKVILKAKKRREEEKNREIEFFNIIKSLSKKELGIITYLLHSGYCYIEFLPKDIPKHVTSLVNKNLIIQIGFAGWSTGRCRFILESSTEDFLREQLRRNAINNKSDE